MEACKKNNPDAIVVYTGTRGQYGAATHFPVSEKEPSRPKGIYEISNLAAEQIAKVYHDIHGVRSILLRLTNIYGPRAQMRHDRFGVANWFMRLAIDGKPIPVFGDGSILRDFLFVDDCVEAILLTAATPRCYGELFNVGHDRPSSFLELARIILKVLGTGTYGLRPFSPERQAQEPGDFFSDVKKIRKFTGWVPRTNLEEGIRKTLDFYAKHKEPYW
jgi:UDP-glucose 4-epimerase